MQRVTQHPCPGLGASPLLGSWEWKPGLLPALNFVAVTLLLKKIAKRNLYHPESKWGAWSPRYLPLPTAVSYICSPFQFHILSHRRHWSLHSYTPLLSGPCLEYPLLLCPNTLSMEFFISSNTRGHLSLPLGGGVITKHSGLPTGSGFSCFVSGKG